VAISVERRGVFIATNHDLKDADPNPSRNSLSRNRYVWGCPFLDTTHTLGAELLRRFGRSEVRVGVPEIRRRVTNAE
jgi:hypothetical protein